MKHKIDPGEGVSHPPYRLKQGAAIPPAGLVLDTLRRLPYCQSAEKELLVTHRAFCLASTEEESSKGFGCMESRLYLDISYQPDSTTCGPTCLHAVYRYFNDPIPLHQVISEAKQLEGGGTLAVYLGSHALARGYKATIYTYNLRIFDPTWFLPGNQQVADKLKRQREYKRGVAGLEEVTDAYLEFLNLGGRIGFEVLTTSLLRRYLNKSLPLLTALSATYLYNSAREQSVGDGLVYDDVRGESTGHFVVVAGYDRKERTVLVADPLKPNPVAQTQYYQVSIYRLICAIMLGVLTYDGDLLIIEPQRSRKPQEASSCYHRIKEKR